MSEDVSWTTPVRLAIGRALLDGPLAESKIAKAIGRDPANVNKTLLRMQAEGLVEVEHEGRPRLWRLAQGEEDALQRRLAEDQQPGHLIEGQRVIAVKLNPADESRLAVVLSSRALLGALAWVAKVEGAAAQYLFVLDRHAPALQISRLVAALSAADIYCERMLVEEVYTPGDLVRGFASLRDIAGN